jgi:hypothetical protein
LDLVCETNSAQFVFQILYANLTAKNPTVPLRIASFIAHHLETYGSDEGINLVELADMLLLLFSHGDLAVRKTATACMNAVRAFDPNAAVELFKFVSKQADAKVPQTNQPKAPKLKPEAKPPRSVSPRASDAEIGVHETFIPARLDELEALLNATPPASVQQRSAVLLSVKSRGHSASSKRFRCVS